MSFHNLQLHAAVLLASFLGGIVRNRTGLAVTDVAEPVRIDAVGNEILHHGLCPGLGKTLVVILVSNAVGMTLNRYVQFRIVNEPCGHLVKLCNDLVRESELVKCE